MKPVQMATFAITTEDVLATETTDIDVIVVVRKKRRGGGHTQQRMQDQAVNMRRPAIASMV